jgi:hypothetical protein
MDNWEQYQKAYQAADEETKSLIHSSIIPESVDKMIKEHNLESNQKKLIILELSNQILGITTEIELVENVRKIGVPNARVAVNETLSFIQNKKPKITDTSLVDDSTSTNKIDIKKSDDNLANEIAEAEAAIESMQPIRTMSHDMEVQRGTPADEPTHTGASQADLLDRTATVKDKNPGATWGTEQT